MIKPILYEHIEQKNEIERELFSKLTPRERSAVAKSWMKLLSSISKHRKSNKSGNRK